MFVKNAYVRSVAAALIDQGVVKYASAEEAMDDAGQVAGAMEEEGLGNHEMLEGQVQPEATAQIAAAIVNMAQEAGNQADVAKQKAEIAANAAAEIAKTGAMKLAADEVKELANSVPNTAERKSYHGAPGHQEDANEGEIGDEEGGKGEGSPGSAKAKDHKKELANAVPNTAERPNAHGPAGHQADAGKGNIGTETKAASLYEKLSRL